MQTLSKIQIALFILLSVVDLITTYLILKAGGSELNPIFANAPGLLIPAKGIAIVLILTITVYINQYFGDFAGSIVPTGANTLTGIVVAHNVVVLMAV